MERLLVLGTLGTDHHRFDRLVDWLDNYAHAHSSTVRVVVQHGASRPPRHAEGVDLVARDTLLRLMQDATVVVTQGGPGSILDARACGHVPVVVARRRAMGEVVDDHQVAFCRAMELSGRATVATGEQHLHDLVSAALADPASVRRPADASPAGTTSRRVREALSASRTRRPGFVNLERLGHVVRTMSGR